MYRQKSLALFSSSFESFDHTRETTLPTHATLLIPPVARSAAFSPPVCGQSTTIHSALQLHASSASGLRINLPFGLIRPPIHKRAHTQHENVTRSRRNHVKMRHSRKKKHFSTALSSFVYLFIDFNYNFFQNLTNGPELSMHFRPRTEKNRKIALNEELNRRKIKKFFCNYLKFWNNIFFFEIPVIFFILIKIFKKLANHSALSIKSDLNRKTSIKK